MTAVERLLAVAAGEVGVKEAPAGSNKVKYNTWFYGREVSGSAYAWCCAFVCWVFHQAGLDALLRKTGGCTTMMNWFKAKGRLVTIRDVKPGDLVFYQFDSDSYADHIGIVVSVTKTGIVAIEGNTSVTSDDNGGAVMRRSRKWSSIMAVARPDYESIDKANTKEEVNMSNAEAAKTYRTVKELPEWAKEPVQRLIDAGIIVGDGKNEISLAAGKATLGDVSMVDKVRLELVAMVDDLRLTLAELAGAKE